MGIQSSQPFYNELNYDNNLEPDSSLLIQKYSNEFNKLYSKDLKYAKILFPGLSIFSITFYISIFLIFIFILTDIYYFDKNNPLFINENELRYIGINKYYISNKYQYFKLLTVSFYHSSVWSLIINIYYFLNIGSIIENKLKSLQYILFVILSSISGNLIYATTYCSDIQLGISPILSAFIGLFTSEILIYYSEIKRKLNIIINYIFTVLSLYVAMSLLNYNGNILGNLAGIFFGICYYFTFMNNTTNQWNKILRIIFIISYLTYLITCISTIITIQC